MGYIYKNYLKLGSPPYFKISSVHFLDLSKGSTPTAKCKTPIPLHGKIIFKSTVESCKKFWTDLD